jgi:hypothetical protein
MWYLIKHGRTGHESGRYITGKRREQGREWHRVHRIRWRVIWGWNVGEGVIRGGVSLLLLMMVLLVLVLLVHEVRAEEIGGLLRRCAV